MSHSRIVLVADDDDLLQAVLAHKLAAVGYAVVLADNGRKALEQVERHAPDILVLDAMMPVMDGFEVLRRIKADRRSEVAELPVLMLTALRRDSDVVTALNLGAADYLSKPFNPDELVARLARLSPHVRQVA